MVQGFKNIMEIEQIVSIIRDIDHQKGKYTKTVLNELEQRGLLTREARKAVLDGFNDFNRSVQRILGYQMEN